MQALGGRIDKIQFVTHFYRHNNNSELLIFTTTAPTTHRFYTFMHDPQYRVAIAWQNVGYNQPPYTSFYVGEEMETPPTPNISLVADGGTNTPAIYLTARGGAAGSPNLQRGLLLPELQTSWY